MTQISKRTSSNGKISWRVRIRVLGYPERSKIFPTKTAAKEWASTIEADLARGVDMISKEALTKTVGQMIDRYIKHYLPTKSATDTLEKVKRGRETLSKLQTV